MATHRSHNRRGFSIVEILLAIFVFVLISTTLIYLLIEISTANQQEKFRLTAVALAGEGLEATRNIRDSGWSNLSVGNHGLAKVNNQWEFSGQSDVDTSGTFHRQISVSALSADRLLITSSISYSFLGLRNISISNSTYLTNWRKVIEPEGPTWEDPVITKIIGTNNLYGNTNPRDVFVNGQYAYLVIEQANAIDPEFFVYNIADANNPSLAGNFKVGSKINSVYVVGNYAFLATNKDDEEFVVLKVDDPAHITKVSSANTPRNFNALDAIVVNNYAYIVTETSVLGNEFSIFDVSNPEAVPAAPVGKVNLEATGRTVSIYGNFAYVGTDSDSDEVKVVNIENKSAPVVVGGLNLPGAANVYAIRAINNAIYVGTDVNSGSNSEFYILHSDTTNPQSVILQITGQLKIGGRINGLALNTSGNRIFAATNIVDSEFYVINIENPAVPVRISSLDLPGEASAIEYNGSYVFVSDIANSQELIIIGP